MTGWITTYLVALVAMLLLDGAWLGFLMKDFYASALGPLMREPILKPAAAAFYFGYPAALLALALHPQMPLTIGQAALRGGLVGLMAYGTYDLTNLATLKGWSLKLAAVDMAWGAVVSGLVVAGGWWWMHRNP